MATGDPPPQVTTTQSIQGKLSAFFRAVFSLPALMSIVLIASLFYIYNSSKGDEGGIADIAYARGLITLLFAVGTIAIALILTLSSIFQMDEHAKDRFDRGREVLGVLIGIFGTIVGFYFGSATPQNASSKNPTIQAITPTTIAHNSEDTLVIIGANFTENSVVLIGPNAPEVKFVTANRLEAQITKNMTAKPSSVSVKVVNTATGLVSKSQTLEIQAASE